MSNSVIIKSFPSGIVLHLDKEIPFEELLMDIGDKFRESSGFFKDAKMALSIADRAYVLETGRIALHDTAAALLKSDVVRRTYLGEG